MTIPDNKIIDILEKYNFKGMRKGVNNNIICFCKFHDNHVSPSFSINTKTGLWCCFSGECALKGNLPKLIMTLEHCSYDDAIKVLFDGNESAIYDMMLDGLDFSEKILEEKKSFKIELYPAELTSIPKWETYLRNINIEPSIALAAGLKVCKNKYCKDDINYYNKLIIPVYDKDNNVLDYELRKWMPDDLGKKVIYLPGSKMSKWVYGFNIIDNNPSTAILVEGVKDVLTIIGYNYFALGLFGTKICKDKVNFLIKSGIKKVIIMLDDDEAGQTAQKKIAKLCSDYFDVCQVFLPDGKDPNDTSKEEFENFVKKNPVLREAYNE